VFEELLAQQHESLTVEFKEPLDWDDAMAAGKLIKAIICLANRDGGYILIGKEQNRDRTFTLVGMPHNLAAKLETTRVNNRLNQYVAPSINANSAQFDDDQGKRYVVVHAPGFARTPHIVTKDYNLPAPKGGKPPEPLFREGDFLIRTCFRSPPGIAAIASSPHRKARRAGWPGSG
jgi:predicted HTH transcriptional regulator